MEISWLVVEGHCLVVVVVEQRYYGRQVEAAGGGDDVPTRFGRQAIMVVGNSRKKSAS